MVQASMPCWTAARDNDKDDDEDEDDDDDAAAATTTMTTTTKTATTTTTSAAATVGFFLTNSELQLASVSFQLAFFVLQLTFS